MPRFSDRTRPKVSVTRSFREFRDNDSSTADESTDWFRWMGGETPLLWSDLFRKRLVVILGEVGIGKTFEFESQANRLTCVGKPAFFLALNQLTNRDALDLALEDRTSDFQQWCGSNEPGYFFLDAVDEARLNSPQALNHALRLVRRALGPHLSRVSLFISSRISDWSNPHVRDSVDQILRAALVSDARDEPSPPVLQAEELPPQQTNTQQPDIVLEAFCLDPLSDIDAKRLAEAHGVTEVDAFWCSIEEGGFKFMATRPLDLEWIARLWRSERRLGTYSELVERAVTERLAEHNPSYTDAGAELSRTQLRDGAQKLAAACTFSGHAHIIVGVPVAVGDGIDPADVLPEWTPEEHQRILGTAVFDEGSYGRVKFHHRSVREYLSACWIERRIHEGLPIKHALDLFIQAPFGSSVLVGSRRAVFCWLAGINATVRDFLVRHHPELLFYESDPQRWSGDDVVEAFDGYVKMLSSGYRPDWVHDSSELRRIATSLPPTLLSKYIERYRDHISVLDRLLLLVEYGPINVCATTVFTIYRCPDTKPQNKEAALQTLAVVATPEQRECVASELRSNTHRSNHLTGLALAVTGVSRFTAEELAGVFRRTEPESDRYGGLQEAIGRRILPGLAELDGLLLIQALLAAISPETTSNLASNYEADGRNDRWMLSVLPDVLLHTLKSTIDDANADWSTLVDAALVVHRLRHTALVNDGDLQSIKSAIKKCPGLRKQLALAIAGNAEDVHSSIMELMPWSLGLVSFSMSDLDLLIDAANSDETSARDRTFWFEFAADLALSAARGRQRRETYDALLSGPDPEKRRLHIAEIRSERIDRLLSHRQNGRDFSGRESNRRNNLAQIREQILTKLKSIRNGSDAGAIQWLVKYSAARGEHRSYTQVELGPVCRDLGKPFADALSEGLTKVWIATEAPDPIVHLDGSRPWSGLIGLAGLNHAVALGMDVRDLPMTSIKLAVQLAIWDYDCIGQWFDALLQSHADIVVAALMPWFESEVKQAPEMDCTRWTMDFVLRGPGLLQNPILERVTELLENSEIPAQSVQKTLLRALSKFEMTEPNLTARIAKRNLGDSDLRSTAAFVRSWFRILASADLPDAWSWVERNSRELATDIAELAALVAGALHESSWARNLSGTESETDALARIYRLLIPFVEQDRVNGDNVSILRPQQQLSELAQSIPGILVGLPGMYAHHALAALAEESADTPRRQWLDEQVRRHAVAEAERQSIVDPADLSSLGEQYCRDPRTEGELFEQVHTRLAEIHGSVETGPFSDRDLFESGIEETKLQLWLAARLSDTPRRRFIPRFVVHREPQVDRDKRTDIEVSCNAGKVCIEIKPVDSTRGYTAASLTKTLSDQLVGQYLRGQNSSHGILVIFRLDKKKWRIPNGAYRGDFADLIRYLQQHAQSIKGSHNGVNGLDVIGIDCVAAGDPP